MLVNAEFEPLLTKGGCCSSSTVTPSFFSATLMPNDAVEGKPSKRSKNQAGKHMLLVLLLVLLLVRLWLEAEEGEDDRDVAALLTALRSDEPHPRAVLLLPAAPA